QRRNRTPPGQARQSHMLTDRKHRHQGHPDSWTGNRGEPARHSEFRRRCPGRDRGGCREDQAEQRIQATGARAKGSVKQRKLPLEQLLPIEDAEHGIGLRWSWFHQREHGQVQRQHLSVALSAAFLIFTCGLGCARRANPQVAFEHAYKTFLHGDPKRSQGEAHEECQRFRDSNPEWSWKFRILEAKSLLLRGMSRESLALLKSVSPPPGAPESIIEILVIEGTAYGRLHSFAEADHGLQ